MARPSEGDSPRDGELRWSVGGDGWFVEGRGKNTKSGEPAVRDAWIRSHRSSNLNRQ